MEDLVMIESKDYAQVLFENIKEIYFKNEPLECHFNLNDLIYVDSSDSIGVYKVGFTNFNDYLCKKQIDANSIIQQGKGKIIFHPDEFLKEKGEFYQFVYVTQSTQIRGASIPFQFKSIDLQNLEEQKTLNIKNEEKIRELKDELSVIKVKCLKLSMDNERLSHELKNKTNQIDLLKTEFELDKMEQVKKLENEISKRVDEIIQIKESLKRDSEIVSEQAKTIQNILLDKDNLTNQINELKVQNSNLERLREELIHELNMCKDKIQGAEQCKEMLRAQLIVQANELNEANSKINKHLETIQDLVAKEKQFEIEKFDFEDKLEKIKNDYESKLNESNGSYYALKLAHSHLEAKLKACEQNFSKLENEKLKQENEELKERIKAGAKEYSKLFEKYRLMKNQQFNKEINIYHDLVGGVHLRRESTSQSHISYQNENESDSALQDRSASESARASSIDIENTLLDALLNSSIYEKNQQQPQQQQQQQQQQQMISTSTHLNPEISLSSSDTNEINNNCKVNTNSNQRITETISDDGLINLRNSNSNERIFINRVNNNDVLENLVIGEFSKLNLEKLIRNNQRSSTNFMSQDSASETNAAELIRTCDICSYNFSNEANINEIEKHYSAHYGPSCPICFLTFRKGYPQIDFENHVNTHFSN